MLLGAYFLARYLVPFAVTVAVYQRVKHSAGMARAAVSAAMVAAVSGVIEAKVGTMPTVLVRLVYPFGHPVVAVSYR